MRRFAGAGTAFALAWLLGGCGKMQPSDPVAAASASASASASDPASAIDAPTARFVKLEEVSEWNGKEWASVAEFDLIDATGATLDRTGWLATADSTGSHDEAANAIDGDPRTLWHSKWEGDAPRPPHWLVIRLPAPVRISGFRYLPRRDRSVNGTIAQYRFFVSADGEDWGAPVAAGDFSAAGAEPGEKTVVFARQTANHPPILETIPAQETTMGGTVSLRVRATDPDGDALAYGAEGLPPGLSINGKGQVVGTPIVPGSYGSSVSASDGKAPPVVARFTWTIRPAAGVVPAGPGEARYVRLEEVSEVNGQPWGAIAEFNLLDEHGTALPRDGWRASADSSDANDQPKNAIDGSAGSIWHSQWAGVPPPPPHSFIVDLGRPARVRGFRYLPRQDGPSNGTIARFRFYTSADGVDWGQPVAEGDFTSMGAAKAEKTVRWK